MVDHGVEILVVVLAYIGRIAARFKRAAAGDPQERAARFPGPPFLFSS
jgi:hypothetical protein